MRPLQIVLSCCQEDQAVADTLIDALTKAGADVWHDTSHAVLSPRMQYHMIASRVFVVLLSPAALSSQEIEAACAYALKRERHRSSYIILPILLAPLDTDKCSPALQTILQNAPSLDFTHMTKGVEDDAGLSDTSALLRQLALTPEHVAIEEMPLASCIIYSKALIQQDRFEDARAVIETITQTHPTLLIGWLLLGIILHDNNQYPAALMSFERARLLAPESTVPLRYLGLTLASLHREQEALSIYNMALSISPDDQYSLLNRGYILSKQGKSNEAIVSYLTILEYEPYYGIAHTNLARALSRIQRFDKAMDQVEHVLTLNPEDAYALAAKASVLVEMNRPAEALPFVERAIALEPWHANNWTTKSQILLRLKSFTAALEATDHGIQIDSDIAMLWNNRGVALTNLNRFTEALANYDRALSLEPDLKLAWTNKIHVLRRMKHFKEGLAFCDARLIEDPQNISLWQFKTLILCDDLKAHSAALPSAIQCVQMAPANAFNWNLLGWVQLHLRNDEAALASFERALAITPSYIVALRNKAFALRRLGQLNESLFVLAQAARLDPKGYRKWGRLNWRNWRFWLSYSVLVLVIVYALIQIWFR